MSWAKVDDRANEHPKQLEAGPRACWLWTCGLMYCNRQPKKTGLIPKRAVHTGMLFPGLGSKEAKELVRVGLWHDDGDFYAVHEHAHWNSEKRTKADPEAVSAVRAEAGRKGGLRSGELRRERGDPDGEANGAKRSKRSEANGEECAKQTDSSRTAARTRAHSRALDPPHPTPPHPKEEKSKGSFRLPRDWDPGSGVLIGTAIPEWAHQPLLAGFRGYHCNGDKARDETGWRQSYVRWAQRDWQDPERRPKPPLGVDDATDPEAEERRRLAMESRARSKALLEAERAKRAKQRQGEPEQPPLRQPKPNGTAMAPQRPAGALSTPPAPSRGPRHQTPSGGQPSALREGDPAPPPRTTIEDLVKGIGT